jgi:hypothetical protein
MYVARSQQEELLDGAELPASSDPVYGPGQAAFGQPVKAFAFFSSVYLGY